MFPCQKEMHFWVGQMTSEKNENLNQFQKFPLQCKLVFDNDDHQWILGAFMKLFYEVSISSECDSLMKNVTCHKGENLLKFVLSKIWMNEGCILVKEQNILKYKTCIMCWLMNHAQSDQPILVVSWGCWILLIIVLG